MRRSDGDKIFRIFISKYIRKIMKNCVQFILDAGDRLITESNGNRRKNRSRNFSKQTDFRVFIYVILRSYKPEH